jgi:hypothetical protein
VLLLDLFVRSSGTALPEDSRLPHEEVFGMKHMSDLMFWEGPSGLISGLSSSEVEIPMVLPTKAAAPRLANNPPSGSFC